MFYSKVFDQFQMLMFRGLLFDSFVKPAYHSYIFFLYYSHSPPSPPSLSYLVFPPLLSLNPHPPSHSLLNPQIPSHS